MLNINFFWTEKSSCVVAYFDYFLLDMKQNNNCKIYEKICVWFYCQVNSTKTTWEIESLKLIATLIATLIVYNNQSWDFTVELLTESLTDFMIIFLTEFSIMRFHSQIVDRIIDRFHNHIFDRILYWQISQLHFWQNL